jgi:hypothetical protein
VGLGVDLPAAASSGVLVRQPSPRALVDYMEVAVGSAGPGADPFGRGEVGMPVRRMTERGRGCEGDQGLGRLETRCAERVSCSPAPRS